MKRRFALFLAMLMILSSLVAVSASGTPARIVIFQEDFEEGVGDFTVQGAEATLYRQEDATGNNYVMVRLNPDKAEAVATFTKTPGGRWGTEFFVWAIQLNKMDDLQNDKNYQIQFDGSYFNKTAFTKPAWGTGVLVLKGNYIWTPSGTDYTGPIKEVFRNPDTGTEMASKPGWYDCYSNPTWLTNYKFGATKTGTEAPYEFSGNAPVNYYHVRSQLATAIAQIMAENKFYCGKGTGLTNASGVPQNSITWGGYYKFTLTRDDFYGDEAIFDGVTDEAAKNAIKDSYIYEADGVTKTEYSLGGDCSFLKSAKRIAAFKTFLQDFQVGYAMDNFRIVANANLYDDTVTITGNGTVTALTNPATNETKVVNTNSPTTVTKNDHFGVEYTIAPATGYVIGSVTVDGQPQTVGTDGILTLPKEKGNAAVNVTFIPGQKYNFAVNASGKGSVTVNGTPIVGGSYSATNVAENTLYDLVVTPTKGYLVSSVKVNNVETPLTDGKLTVSLSANTTVDIVFAKQPWLTMKSISLSENTSFYQEAVTDKELKVWGYAKDGTKQDLTGSFYVTYDTEAPWIFNVVGNKLSSGSSAGSTLISATYQNPDGSKISTSIWMSRTETTPVTFGLNSGGKFEVNDGSFLGHDGGTVLAAYKQGVEYNNNYELRAYTGRTNAPNDWYTKGMRATQGWFYDDGVSNSGFYIAMNDSEYYNPDGINKDFYTNAAHNNWSVSSYPIGAFNNASYYVTGTTGNETTIPRTVGWHQVMAALDDDTKSLNIYLDGQLVVTKKPGSSTASPDGTGRYGDSCFELRSTQGVLAGYTGAKHSYEENHYFDNIALFDMPKSVAPAMAPVAKNIIISGPAMVGQTMKVTYEVKDYNNDELDAAKIQWQVSSDEIDWQNISGATGETYQVAAAQQGKYIRAAVTPYAKADPKQGTAAYSIPSAQVSEVKLPPSASNVIVSGKAEIASELTATYTYVKSAGGDAEGDTQIVWEASDSSTGPFAKVSEGASYLINATVAGKYVRASVTPKDTNGLAGVPASSAVVKVPGNVSYYVALNGNDSNPGTIDKPFLTLEAARDAIRGSEIPDGGVTVYIREGTYYRTRAFALTSADSGREGAPVVYRAYGDEKVVIHGGYDLDLSKFSNVSGSMKDLLPASAQGKVMVASLTELNVPTITEYSIMGADGGLNAPILNLDGKAMHISRYPNTRDNSVWPIMYCSPGKAGYEGTNLGNGETDAKKAFTVQYDEATAARVNSWTYGLDHVAAEGYWKYDWYASTRYVTIDKAKKQITAREDRNTQYGVMKDQDRVFCFKNVYQELDEAGEYYIDFEEQKIYVYPYDGTTNNSSLKINALTSNMVDVTNASYVTISGLEFTSGKGKAMNISNARGIVVDNCYINGFQTNAITMTSVYDSVIKNSDIEFCGTGAVTFSGGDKATLTPGKNRVENNKINDFAMLKTIYSPGVSVDGVGNYVSNNEVYNAEHYAIYYAGVDNIIEYNNIHHACTNAADMGAIYTGRHFDDHGTIIRYNHFSDIGNPLSRRFFPCGIFTDDGSSDLDVYGNVFGPGMVTTEAIKIHGGQNNNAYHNIFIDTPVVIYHAEWPDSKWRASLTDPEGKSYAVDQYWNRFDSVRNNPLYRERWPWLAVASDAYDAGDYNKIVHNSNMLAENLIIYVNEGPEEFVRSGSNMTQATKGWWRAYGYHAIIGTNDAGGNTNVMLTNENGDNKKYFVDYDNGDYRLKDNSLYDLFDQTDIKGKFEPIPFDEMGMYESQSNAPTASAVSISGDLASGSSLSGLYDYNDPERDPEGTSTYRWLVSDSINGTYTAISGATGKTFTVDSSYSGKFLKFEVTPASYNGGKGLPVVSSAFAIAADKTALNKVITAVESAIANVKVGSALGEYTSGNVTILQSAVDAAKVIAAKESPTASELSKAAGDLSNAFADFLKTANNKETTANNTANVTAGLSDVELNFTGSQKEVTVNFEGVAPKTSIAFGGVNINIPSGTLIPNGTLKISLPDNPSIILFGDLTTLVKVGETGDVFNNAIRIELEGNISQDVLRIGTETYELITRTLESDQASALGTAKMGKFKVSAQELSVWTKLGGEYAVASLIVPSQDAVLKNMQINGKEYAKFRPETTSYKYVVPSTTTELPVVTAQANDENATVVIENVTAVPGTATITVTAQDLQSKTVYSIAFSKITEPSPSPTNDGGNGGGNGGNNGPIVNQPTSPTSSIPAISSGNRSDSTPFTDINGHWAEADINEMYQKDIVSGISDTLFDPDRNITRAEFAALVTRALGLKTTVSAEFIDVNPFEWYYNSVNTAAAAGLIAGHDGYFRPNDLITREEMAVIIAKAYVFLGNVPQSGGVVKFEDAGDISDWAFSSVDHAATAGLISGKTSSTFQPKDNATRAECTSLIKRVLTK